MQFSNLDKTLKNKIGIYKLAIGGHIYIGSSKNLYNRLHEHKIKLYNNKHPNSFLQNCINKYGLDKCDVDIIEFCSEENRFTREAFWIKELNADCNFKDPITLQISEESKIKLSNSIKKGRAEGKYKMPTDFCEIYCYDYLGNFLSIFKTKEEAANAIGCSVKSIIRSCSGYKKGTSVNGYRFRYACSKVPEQKWEINPQYLGRYYNFYYKDENNQEYLAFTGIKDIYQFLSKQILENKEIKIYPKFKNSVNLQKPLKEGNANPSAVEIQ